MNTPAAESLESQVKTLNERQQGWDQVLRFRVSGFEKLSNRCHEISRGSREFWRLKHEVGDHYVALLRTVYAGFVWTKRRQNQRGTG